jgi:hypothetical protein
MSIMFWFKSPIKRTIRHYNEFGLRRTLSAIYRKLRGRRPGNIAKRYRRPVIQPSSLSGPSHLPSSGKQAFEGEILSSKRPLVSVILASYNHAAYVGNAVISVLEQDLKDIEVIVIDDGSNDGTPDIVAGIKDPRVQLIRLDENRRFHPRNTGLTMARGCYVAFQNSDDEWYPAKLSTQIEAMEKNQNITACFTGVEIIDKKGNQVTGTWADGVFSTKNRKNTAWLRQFFDYGNCLCMPSSVVRLNQIKELNGFRASLVQLGDLDLWVRLAAMGDIHIIDKKYTRMRVIPETNVSRPNPSGRRCDFMEYCEVLGRYPEPPVLSCLPQTFSDVLPEGANSTGIQLAGLALYALELGNAAHRILADRILARLLEDAGTREEIATAYGTPIVYKFIKNRGDLAVLINRGE